MAVEGVGASGKGQPLVLLRPQDDAARGMVKVSGDSSEALAMINGLAH